MEGDEGGGWIGRFQLPLYCFATTFSVLVISAALLGGVAAIKQDSGKRDHVRTSIVYLLGSPGVGKFSIACEIAKASGAVVVDNQLINQPILALFKWDGRSKLPPGILSRATPIRNAVLAALDEIAPKSMSYVLTNALENTVEARDLFERIEKIALNRGSAFIPVVLSCGLEEQLRRVTSKDRPKRLKISDADIVRKYIDATDFFVPDRADLLELDTTSLSPERAAGAILRHVAGQLNDVRP